VPNYLVSGETGFLVVEPVADGDVGEDSNFNNVDNGPSFSNAGGNISPMFGLNFGGGIGGGSKPAALHTEYAEDGDDGPAYGSQDIVFYLERADGDSNDPTGDALTDEEAQGAEQIGQSAGVGLDGSTGPNADSGQLQSGANQIGAGSFAANGGLVDSVEGSQMAPIVGMSIDDEEDLGRFTQNAGASVDVGRSVQNAVRSVDSLDLNTLNTSLASSEFLFTKLLARNFAFGEDLSGVRDADTILNTLNRPAFSELSFLLARASGGRARVKDIVRAMNDGQIGLVTGKSRAYQQRLGSAGRAPR
jgi:hypothetical protein